MVSSRDSMVCDGGVRLGCGMEEGEGGGKTDHLKDTVRTRTSFVEVCSTCRTILFSSSKQSSYLSFTSNDFFPQRMNEEPLLLN